MPEYAERDPEALEPHYNKHVSAMTSERLYEKSAIAAELAYRDARIEALEAARKPTSTQICDVPTVPMAMQIMRALDEQMHLLSRQIVVENRNGRGAFVDTQRKLSKDDHALIRGFVMAMRSMLEPPSPGPYHVSNFTDTPYHFAAVEKWVGEHRQDLVPMLEQMKTNNGFILLLNIGIEAGRLFQRDNPNFPFNQPNAYLGM